MNDIARIQVLPTDVVDQIAAGEVVERPAHLVKELVENSLDAGATEVSVEFANGGREVVVTDNGCGIHPEDLRRALDRHATSKVKKTDDLWQLQTYGFRGEALASISAVSRLTLSSRPSHFESGSKVISDFGRLSDVQSLGHSPGTRVQVQELFSNVPARLKFLKSPAAESSQIKMALKALALAYPKVTLKIAQEGELVALWPACSSRVERVRQILELESLFEGQAEREGVRAHAVFSDPHHTSKTSKNIWLFAQGRWIQDRALQAAVMEAYRHLLMHGEYPLAAVWVETDPQAIDVNIHPTKSQVKFQDPSLAFRAVQASVRDVLQVAPWIKKDPLPLVSNLQFEDATFARSQYQSKPSLQSFREPIVDYEKPLFTHLQNAAETRESQTSGYWSSLQVLGQAHLTYVICQSREGLVFIDQHASHERILFEKFMLAWAGKGLEVQDFLFPIAIDLSPDKVEAVLTQQNDFRRLGVELELLGPGTIGIKAGPTLVKDSVFAELLDLVATEILDQGGSYSMEKAVGNICASMACHSAIRAGQALSLEEMQALLKSMDEFPLSSFCPHGRPVSVPYSLAKLERDFGRSL